MVVPSCLIGTSFYFFTCKIWVCIDCHCTVINGFSHMPHLSIAQNTIYVSFSIKPIYLIYQYYGKVRLAFLHRFFQGGKLKTFMMHLLYVSTLNDNVVLRKNSYLFSKLCLNMEIEILKPFFAG